MQNLKSRKLKYSHMMTRKFYREKTGHYHALAAKPTEHEVTSYDSAELL